MLNISKKVIWSALAIYGTSAMKQHESVDHLERGIWLKGDTHYHTCKEGAELKYTALLQNISYHHDMNDDSIDGLCYNHNLYYYQPNLSIKEPIAKLAIDGIKAVTGCILGKLIVNNIEQFSEDRDAKLSATMLVSGLCGGIVAAIAPKHHNTTYIKNLTLYEFPLEYNIIGSVVAAFILAGIWYEDKTDSNSEVEIAEIETQENDITYPVINY